MPTIDVSLKDLSQLVGVDINLETFDKDAVLWVKGEIDGFDEKDIIKLDCKDSNRPDLWSAEGVARQIKPLFEKRKGIPRFKVEKTDLYVHVDRTVDHIRPYICMAKIENISLDDNSLRQLIQLQEKIALSFGRKRSVVGAGLFDADKVTFPLTYKAVKPTEAKFVPLGFNKEMNLKEILTNHPKGIEFKHLLKNTNKYPILIDSKGKILTMPPITNSADLGKVTEETRNLLVEVTGTSFKNCMVALNIFVAALSDRGGKISTITSDYGEKKVVTPNFEPKKIKVKFDDIKRITGMDFTLKEMKELLERFSYNVKKSKTSLEVEYPAYRQDILHPIDVIEDMLISYGYNNIEPIIPTIATVGILKPLEEFSEKIRNSLVGFGAQELLNFTLTNKEVLFTKMNIKENEVIEIANPVSSRWTCLRNWAIPSLLSFFEANTSQEYPQQIYEVGDIALINEKAETRSDTVRKLAWALADNNASFTRAKQILDFVLRGLSIEYSINEIKHGSFIEGRCGEVIINEKVVGLIGEINPLVLDNFGLNFPICTFELDVNFLHKIKH
jgi:phenylalanyl-tRNA synthetase beta chain